MKKVDLTNLNPQAVTTFIVTALAVVNMILRLCGWEQVFIPDDQIYDLVSSVFLIGSMMATAYKNFNVTSAAVKAQEITDMLKEGTLLIEDVDKMIQSIRERDS